MVDAGGESNGSPQSLTKKELMDEPILRLGSLGEAVETWKEILIKDNYDVSRDPFEEFGKATYNGTIGFQKARLLTPDGVVGPKTWGAKDKKAISPGNPASIYISKSFLQAANYTPANRTEIKWLVLHSMEAKEASSTAENVAKYFAGTHGPAPEASAHFNIDDDSIVQSVLEKDVGWHAKGCNKYSIGLEHAGYARQSEKEWNDPFSITMLRNSAYLAARLCKKWNIPVAYIDRKGLVNGDAGITTHNEITYAFKKGTHTDPGKGFPIDQYIQMVKDYIDEEADDGVA